MRKTIVLGTPSDFYLFPLIKASLINLNFEVIDISFPQTGFQYKNVWQRLINSYRKVFLNDRVNKVKLRFANYEEKIEATLSKMDKKADFVLLIRPDIYPDFFLRKLKLLTDVLIGYQWDGLERFPWVKSIIPLFDKFYVFDAQDIEDNPKLNLNFLTNFYFEVDLFPIKHDVVDYGIYYLGTYDKNRMKLLNEFLKHTSSLNLRQKIYVYNKKRRKAIAGLGAQQIFSPINYDENINNVRRSKMIVDIAIDIHKGLSFRIFEAIRYDKKIVTNVKEIKKYDFYRPENIFVIGDDSYCNFTSFLRSPYVALDPHIKLKYGFNSWINYVLNIP